jgi:hypothetical protein
MKDLNKFLTAPDKICYTVKGGAWYTYKDFLYIAKDNPSLARVLFDLCETEPVETVFTELLNDKLIDEAGNLKV